VRRDWLTACRFISGAAGLKAWSVVSYFLRYFSSTSTEQISPDSAGPFIVSIRLALLFLLLTPAAALRIARTAADLERLAEEVDAAGQDVEEIRAIIERYAKRRTQAMETISTTLTAEVTEFKRELGIG
jgi:hypothetical protein